MLQIGLIAVMVFSPLARGTVEIWSITPVELGIFLLVFIWLWRASNREGKFIKTRIDLPIWLFIGLAAVSFVFSIYKYVSFLDMMRLFMYVGVFYLVVNNFDRAMSLRLAITVIVMAAAMSVFGLAQYFLGVDNSWWRPENFLASTYVNHNHFAGYLEMAMPLTVAFTLALKKDKVSSKSKFMMLRIGLILSLVFMLVALLLAQSRGAWLSLTISLIVMNIILVKRRVLPKWALYIFLFIIFVAVAYILGGTDDVAYRFRSVEQINNESFLGGREKIWKGSIKMIADNPIIGTGIGTFVWGLPQYRPEGLKSRAHYAHNDYLHMMAEMGILALPLMLWMIFVVVSTGFRWYDSNNSHKNSLGLTEAVVLGSAVGILSLSLHGLVDFNFHIPANMLVVSIMSGIIMRRAKGRV